MAFQFLKNWEVIQFQKRIKFYFSICIILLGINSFGGLKIPNGLDQDKRKEFIKHIGFSSAYKYLPLGYILGGYDGLEISTSIENIPFSKSNYLSQDTINETDKVLQSFIFGKGLYHNVDIFFTFSPLLVQNQISSYGFALRYIFYEDPNRPLNFGFLFHGNGINFSNLIGVQTSGLDIVFNYYLNYWSIYFGFGLARSLGSFVGGANGVTSDQLPADEDVFQNRYYGGISYNLGSFAVTFQLDKIYNESYSAKIGKRF